MVGGLADWFAVTALFRHPLGLPIPHTALIPRNWELLAARVGAMVGGRVLTRDYVTGEITRADIADLLARAAERVGRPELEAGVHALAGWAARQVPPESAPDVAGWLRQLLLDRPIAPLVADAVEVACRYGWDQRAIEALAAALVRALERPEIREAAGDLVDDVVGRYRARVGAYPGMLIGIARLLGLIDRRRLVAALQTSLTRSAQDPGDPFRSRLSTWIAELPQRLRTEPALARRLDDAKTALLASPAVATMFEDAARGLERALLDDVARADSQVVRWITDQLEAARATVASDAALRRDLDRWLKARAIALVAAYQDRVAVFIERGVHALGPEGAVRLIEEHAGDDLQYVRVNGTVVGGLAGGAIYGAHLLLSLL